MRRMLACTNIAMGIWAYGHGSAGGGSGRAGLPSRPSRASWRLGTKKQQKGVRIMSH